jgi:ubiquinone/menaquinone biosynthesis C-methylase UbiE
VRGRSSLKAELIYLDLQHQLFYETLNGRLSLAPIKNPHNVLDIGTGTGVWAMDFGK